MTSPDDRFTLLHVCTANICRSPMAERLTRAMLADRLGPQAAAVRVESAGVWGHEGSGMEPEAASVLTELGADAAGFVARELTRPMVAGADLVLTATRQHRAAVVALHPRASGSTFTLLEFARLTGDLGPDSLPGQNVVTRGRALVRAAAARRGIVPPEAPDDDDLADPYRVSVAAFRTCGTAVGRALEGPLDLLAAGVRPTVA